MTHERDSSDPAVPRYWQSLGARDGDEATLAAAEREFLEELPLLDGALVPLGKDTSRRDFFSLMGLSAAAVGLAACQKAPVTRLVPQLVKQEDQVAGVPRWYASACAGCAAKCGVLLKVRDGRPIKVEGNPEHPWSKGAVCATGQASILSLYDASRARGPVSAGAATSWPKLDAAVMAGLKQAAADGKAIRVIAPPRLGPSGEAALAKFLAAHANARTVRFDAAAEVEPLAEAVGALYRVRALPEYKLEEATVVASFGADFLGTWLAPAAFARRFSEGRALPLVRRDPEGPEGAENGHQGKNGASKPEGGHVARFTRLWVLEPALSLTGSNADRRQGLAPSELLPALAGLVKRLAAGSTHPQRAALLALVPDLPEPAPAKGFLDALARDLTAARSQALVLAGGSDPALHALALLANELLGSVGTTLDVSRGVKLDERALPFATFAEELDAGKIGAALVLGTNFVYAHPEGARLAERLAKVPLVVATTDRADETAQFAHHLAPTHSPYEAWTDDEPRRGLWTLGQPALLPLFDTRATTESLLAWAGAPQGQLEWMRERARLDWMPLAQEASAGFEAFWQRSVQDGFLRTRAEPFAAQLSLSDAGALLRTAAPAATTLELLLVQKVALRDGLHANNAWLQELPDPVTKNSWDNLVMLSPARAKELGLADGDVVTVSAGGRSVSAPALLQPGMHGRCVALALGYGRTHAGAVGNGIGVHAAPLARVVRGGVRLDRADVTLARTGEVRPLALSQTHASLEGRPHLREATLAAYAQDAGAGNPPEEPRGSLWSAHDYPGHRWGLTIDLTRCNGCAACLVSCQAENNVAVVGRDEVLRKREMYWIRIDRYYAGDPESPQVLHQPMLCQHCTNAPCETVCPVLATVHSSEGLNQQIYNRCLGTRYCANNCPPKVRRFNWFENRHDDAVERLVLNPDVVVRSRGVMEKCSLCVQRIGDQKALARREDRPLRDGEIQTACQESCPTQAIVFGDLNDPQSRVAQRARDARAYHVLAELNIGPAITYLTHVKNPGSDT